MEYDLDSFTKLGTLVGALAGALFAGVNFFVSWRDRQATLQVADVTHGDGELTDFALHVFNNGRKTIRIKSVTAPGPMRTRNIRFNKGTVQDLSPAGDATLDCNIAVLPHEKSSFFVYCDTSPGDFNAKLKRLRYWPLPSNYSVIIFRV